MGTLLEALWMAAAGLIVVIGTLTMLYVVGARLIAQDHKER